MNRIGWYGRGEPMCSPNHINKKANSFEFAFLCILIGRTHRFAPTIFIPVSEDVATMPYATIYIYLFSDQYQLISLQFYRLL